MMTTEKQNIEHIIKVAINMVFIKSMHFAKGGGGGVVWIHKTS